MIVMLSHGLVSGALFLCVGVIYDRLHTREIDRYGGLADNMPGYALLFMLFTMASVGLPGTSGFVGEFLSLVGTYQRLDAGRRSSRPPASSSAPPTCCTSTGGSASATLRTCRCGGDAGPVGARMVAARADRARRCCGWASIPKASCGRCAPTSAGCWSAVERAAPPGDSQADRRQARTDAHRRRRTDEPASRHPSRADPDRRRARADDGRRVRRPPRVGVTAGLAVALLLAATFALIGAPSNAGPLFGGLIAADAVRRVRQGRSSSSPPRWRSSPRTAGSSAASSMRRISGADPVQRGRHAR